MNFESICAREVEDPRTTTPHILPIYATSSYTFESAELGIDIFSGTVPGHVYSRHGNPTVDAVAAKIAALESHETGVETSGLLVSSGQAAVATLILATLKAGDKILTQGNLYGATTELVANKFSAFGIETILTDLHDLDHVELLLRKDERIRLLFCETPANPTNSCVDIAALACIAREYGRLSAVDNTFATPYLQQPLRFGADYVLHSTAKYLNGHGNSIAGAIITRHLDQTQSGGILWQARRLSGTNTNAWDAWLVHNGLKTLPLRMERQSTNALSIATFLETHPAVARVNYCGLPSHPDHAIALKQMRAFGALLSFELKGGKETGIRFMNGLRMCTIAPTFGDVDTLVLHPASSSHLNIPLDIRLRHGITDGLVRISTGIEHIDDIVSDLSQALEKC